MSHQTSLELDSNQESFFNTLKAENPELATYKAKSKSQEIIIWKEFYSGRKYTALLIKRITGINQDSAKRSITVLKNRGVLTKLSKYEMIQEEYGKPNHQYQLTKFVSEESKKLIEQEIEEKLKTKNHGLEINS